MCQGASATVSGKRSRRGRRAIRAVRQPLTSATSDFAWEDAITDEGTNACAEPAVHCTAVTRSRSPWKGDGLYATRYLEIQLVRMATTVYRKVVVKYVQAFTFCCLFWSRYDLLTYGR